MASLRALKLFARRQFSPLLSVRNAPRVVAALPWFLKSRHQYVKSSTEHIPWLDTFPLVLERGNQAGVGRGHYFYQDAWAARRVFQSGVPEHVDVGSRVDGFVAHCSAFTTVTYIDLRPLETRIPTIRSQQGTVLALPFGDRSVASLSCLHVAEHIGLGRYGDPIDPDGTNKAIRELSRVLAPGGHLYFGIPIGRERVCFNAHRVFDPRTIRDAFDELELLEFAAVDDAGDLHDPAAVDEWNHAEYGCGLFHFRRA